MLLNIPLVYLRKNALYIYTVSRYSAILKDINMSKAHAVYEHILQVSSEDVKIYKAFCIMQSEVYGQGKGWYILF